MSVSHHDSEGGFVRLIGNPVLETKLFSFIKNKKPAISGVALDMTIRAIKIQKGPQLSKPQGIRPIPMLTLADGSAVYAGSKRYLDFQNELASRLESFEISPTANGAVTGGGLVRTFEKLRTHAEKVMNPTTTPHFPTIGTNTNIPEEYLRTIRLVTELYTEEYEPAATRQNSKSNFGSLVSTSDKHVKIQAIHELVRTHCGAFVKAMVTYDSKWFVENYDCAPVTYMTYRVQLDALGKKREGYDSLGYYHKEVDKSLDPMECFGHVMTAARMRTAYAVDGLSNAIAQGLWSSWRKTALHKFSASWHISTDEDVLRPLEQFGHYRQYDAVQFDSTFPRIVLRQIFNSCVGTTDTFAAYMDRLASLPLVVKSDFNDQAFAYLFNSTDYAAALQSGICCVSDANKIKGTSDWIYGLHLIGHFNYEDSDDTLRRRYAKLLRHEDTMFGLLNQGDDTWPLSRSAKQLDRWCEAVEKLDFAKWEEEFSHKYLGKVVYRDTPTSPRRIIPDIVTLVEKLFLNEHGMHGRHRPLAAAGNAVRWAEMGRIPVTGPAVRGIIDELFLKHFGTRFEAWLRDSSRYDRDPELSQNLMEMSLNQATKEFLQNPDVIHYRFSPEEIDPRILALHFEGISANDTAHIVRSAGFMKPDFNEHTAPRDTDGSSSYKFTGVNDLQSMAA
jgi:hypothetical protein